MTRRRVGVALVCLLASGSVWGQERPRPPGAAAGRDEAFRMIDAYIVSNLQESLSLSDEGFVKLLPLVKKLQKDRRAYLQDRRQALQDLRRTLEAGGATEARVLEQLKALKSIELEEPAVLRKDLEAIDVALTPMQQARFRVMEVEIEAKIREMMNRVRAERRSNRGKNGPGAPPEQEDSPAP